MFAIPQRLVPSGIVSLVAHVGVVAALFLTTLRPHQSAAAPGQPVLISWPQPSEGHGGPLYSGPGPIPPISVPVPPRVEIPPTDYGVRFDPRLPFDYGRDASAGHGTVGDGAWSIGAVEEPPVLLAGPSLAYPEGLRRAGISGRAIVQAVIDTLGRVEPASVVVESALAVLEAPARTYVLGALFRPGRASGRAVRVLVRLPIAFTLAPRR